MIGTPTLEKLVTRAIKTFLGITFYLFICFPHTGFAVDQASTSNPEEMATLYIYRPNQKDDTLIRTPSIIVDNVEILGSLSKGTHTSITLSPGQHTLVADWPADLLATGDQKGYLVVAPGQSYYLRVSTAFLGTLSKWSQAGTDALTASTIDSFSLAVAKDEIAQTRYVARGTN